VLVKVRNGHSTLVSVVIDHFSTQEPLFLFAESFKNVVWANLHNANFVGETSFFGVLIGTRLIVTNFFVTTAGDLITLKSHELGSFLSWVAETTRLVTKSLCLTVWVPVVVGLVVSMPFLERVIKIAVKPVELWNNAKVEGHLSVLVGGVLVALTDRIQLLVQVGVNNLVTKIIVRLLPVVLGNIRRVEIDSSHIFII